MRSDRACVSHLCHTLPMAKGTIKETQPGVWRVRVDAGVDPVTGKRIQLSKVVRGGVRAAEGALRKLHKEAAEGKKGRQSASVGELLDQWLVNAKATLSPKSEPGNLRTAGWISFRAGRNSA